jgi:hypothetical protein
MTPDQRFFAIMTLIVAVFGVTSGIATLILRTLWKASSMFQDLLDQIKAINLHVEQHIISTEVEHDRLRSGTKDVSRRVERHLRQHERGKDAVRDS